MRAPSGYLGRSFLRRNAGSGSGGVRATIVPAHLETSSNTSSAVTHDTGSISPTPGALVLVWIQEGFSSAGAPTLAGCGMTWTQVVTVSGGSSRRLTLFRGQHGAPTPGVLTMTHVSAAASVCWSISQYTGVVDYGDGGAGAVVQFDTTTDLTGAATTITMTLAALENAANVHAAGFGLNVTTTIAADAVHSFTQLGQDNEVGNAITIESEWAVNQTDCAPTFALAGIAYGISVELRSA